MKSDGLHHARVAMAPSSQEQEVMLMASNQRARMDGLLAVHSEESLALDDIQPSTCGSTRTGSLIDLDSSSVELSVVTSGDTHEAEESNQTLVSPHPQTQD